MGEWHGNRNLSGHRISDFIVIKLFVLNKSDSFFNLIPYWIKLISQIYELSKRKTFQIVYPGLQ